MAKTLGPVALKLGDEVLVKVRNNTTVKDLLEQLDRACKGGRIQDVEGFDVTAHYSQDLPEGDYAIKQPAAGGSVAAAFLTNVTVVIVQQVGQFLQLQSAFKACRPLDLSGKLLFASLNTVSMQI